MAITLPSKQGICRVDGDNKIPAVIADICYFRGTGNPTGVVTPNQAGDWYTDTTNGFEWLANGSTSSSWSLVSNGSPVVQTYVGSLTLAQINAGAVLVPAIAGHTLKPIYCKIIPVGTATSGGPVTLKDSSGTVSILSVTFGALATAVGANPPCVTSEVVATGATWGAGMGGALTAANGIAIAGGTLVGLTSATIIIEYTVS
jgi:hypothetical protein